MGKHYLAYFHIFLTETIPVAVVLFYSRVTQRVKKYLGQLLGDYEPLIMHK